MSLVPGNATHLYHSADYSFLSLVPGDAKNFRSLPVVRGIHGGPKVPFKMAVERDATTARGSRRKTHRRGVAKNESHFVSCRYNSVREVLSLLNKKGKLESSSGANELSLVRFNVRKHADTKKAFVQNSQLASNHTSRKQNATTNTSVTLGSRHPMNLHFSRA